MFDGPTDATATRLTEHFELAREHKEFGLAVFPRITSAAEVCRLLELLGANRRWRCALLDDVPEQA